MATLSKKTLLFIILSFTVPIIVAIAMYIKRDHFVFSTTNVGEFVAPNTHIKTFSLNNIDSNYWHLAYVSPQECAKMCVTTAEKLTSIHRALGRDSSRVQTTIILQDDYHDKYMANQLSEQVPDLNVSTTHSVSPCSIFIPVNTPFLLLTLRAI